MSGMFLAKYCSELNQYGVGNVLQPSVELVMMLAMYCSSIVEPVMVSAIYCSQKLDHLSYW